MTELAPPGAPVPRGRHAPPLEVPLIERLILGLPSQPPGYAT